MTPLLKPKEAAALLDVCTKTLRKHVRAGHIPSICVGMGTEKKHRMYDHDDLRAFIASRREREYPSAPQGPRGLLRLPASRSTIGGLYRCDNRARGATGRGRKPRPAREHGRAGFGGGRGCDGVSVACSASLSKAILLNAFTFFRIRIDHRERFVPELAMLCEIMRSEIIAELLGQASEL